MKQFCTTSILRAAGISEDLIKEFNEFHLANPEFIVDVLRIVAKLLKANIAFSNREVLEYARFNVKVRRRIGDFKINNNLFPLYARIIVAVLPAAKKHIHFRKITRVVKPKGPAQQGIKFRDRTRERYAA